jgi:hypothetical protein
MNYWPVADLLRLARLVQRVGDSFTVRRTFQRLDRDEITVAEANALLTVHLEHARMQSTVTPPLLKGRCEGEIGDKRD